MTTETTETAEVISPFSAALDAAFKTQEEDAPAPPETKPEKKAEKAPVDETKKDATPRELFKKDAKTETAPPKVEEPKSAIDEIAEPSFKDAKGRAGWDALKKEAKAHEEAVRAERARVKELEAKLAEVEPIRGKVTEYEKKLAEQSELVARVSLEDHPDYRREFIEGRTKLVSKAQAIIEESGGDAKEVETALNLKGKARVEALREVAADLDSFQSGRLGRVIDELTDLDDRAEAKRADARKSYEEMKEQERQREIAGKTKQREMRRAEFGDTVQRLRGKLEVLTKAEGHDEWNSRADRIIRDAEEAVEANPTLDIEAEILARSIPAYRDLFLQADSKLEASEKEIAALKAELKAIHGKSPSLGGARRTTATAKGESAFFNALDNVTGGE